MSDTIHNPADESQPNEGVWVVESFDEEGDSTIEGVFRDELDARRLGDCDDIAGLVPDITFVPFGRIVRG
jgi:hypothetical protein